MSEQQVAHFSANVEYDGTNTQQQVAAFTANIEYTGGYDTPTTQEVGHFTANVEFNNTSNQLQVAHFGINVEYAPTYPNVTLTRYQPRILVDFFLDTGPKRMSTEELYVEEL